MSQNIAEKSSKFDKIRQLIPQVTDLLETGECPDSAPVLNLPFRFFAYADKNNLDNFFFELYQTLEAAKKSHLHYANGQDVWFFDEVIKIIAPEFQKSSTVESLHFLIKHCNIPEGHLRTEMHQVSGLIAETDQIYLSRYAMLLLTRKLMREQMIFREDWSAPLFISGLDANAIQNKMNFDREMRAAFAGFYFAHPSDNLEKLTQNVWDWIRGGLLKSPYDRTNNNLKLIYKKLFNPETIPDEKQSYHLRLYHAFENFKQDYIFKPLFMDERLFWSFKIQYESALLSEEFGFSKKPNNKGKIQWIDAAGNTMPLYPGPNFAPHMDFFISWTIRAFCEYYQEEQTNCPEENKMEWLEALTKDFFSAVRYGYDEAKNKRKFSTEPIFIKQHNSDAVKVFKNNKKRTELDENQLLFRDPVGKPEESEIWVLNARKGYERLLAELHEQYRQNPSIELAQKIDRTEINISDENRCLYGVNLGLFNSVPETLTQHGQFIPRPAVCRKHPFQKFYTYKSKPEKVESLDKSIQLDIFQKEISDHPEALFEGIYATRTTSERFHRFTGKWNRDPNGPFECINEFISETRDGNWVTMDGKRSETGRVRKNCRLKYMLFEWDHLELKGQWEKVLANISYICQAVYSGNRSIHVKIAIKDEPKTLEEYDWLRNHILMKFGFVDSDPMTKDNSRCTRVPNATNPDTNRRQQLLHYDPNAYFSDDWRPLFKIEKQKVQTKITVPYEINDSWRHFWIARINEFRAELTEGNRTYMLPKIVNSAACSVVTPDEFLNILGDLLDEDNKRWLKTLYKMNSRSN
ncbi:MAG: hypothetical protein FWE50_00145 [Alphaproteobacteria bacterium]|nr:hypothetical protein [Alphaproteobacteria bacterium]